LVGLVETNVYGVHLLREIGNRLTRCRLMDRAAWIGIFLVALGSSNLSATADSNPLPPAQQIDVLFLSSLDPDSPDVSSLVQQTEKQVLDGSERPVRFSFDYLDFSSSLGAPTRERATAAYLTDKYSGRTFQLVIAIGEKTAIFAEQMKPKLFPDGALIFFVANPKDVQFWLKQKPGITGVVREANYLSTLQLALQQNPGTSHVVVVSGSSEDEKLDLRIARQQFAASESSLRFDYLTDLKFSELSPRLTGQQPGTVILFLDFQADTTGERFVSTRVLRGISRDAKQPIYGAYSSFVGAGAVGGSVAVLNEVGQTLGSDGARILKGEKPQNVPVATGDFQRYTVDWRQLRRWGISESLLPQGSVVLFREPTNWELYRWRIVVLSAVLTAQTLLILWLLRSIAVRRRAEEELKRKDKELSDAHQLALYGNWSWNPVTHTMTWSKSLYAIHGIDPSGPPPSLELLSKLLTPESMQLLDRAMDEALVTGYLAEIELEFLRPDGTHRWARMFGEAIRDSAGHVSYVWGSSQDITDRKHMLAELHASQSRLKAIVDSAMDAIIAVNDQQLVLFFNAAAERMLGCPASEVIGTSIERFSPQRFRAENRVLLRHFAETGAVDRPIGLHGTLWAVRANGEEFPIEASISQSEDDGKKLFTVIVRDITERRRAEDAAAESEKRFRLIANTAPVLIWMSDTDKQCHYFNQSWLDFTGRTVEQEFGNGWAEGVHAADLQGCMDTYSAAFDRRQEFRMEYRLRRHDGEYRWLVDVGVPRFHGDGSFAGYVGCCIDITDQKEARTALMHFSARLMRAEEEERARIARELHDDISQRLALLANGLQEAGGTTSLTRDSLPKQRLHALLKLTLEIASDIQDMSHKLHPSKLQYLGLGSAIRDLCREVSQQHKIEIEFVVRDIPDDFGENVSLNLFRIVQEALRNVVKHSKARHVKVELSCESNVVHLRVSDDGIGFNPDSVHSQHGLGLTSMRERLRSLGGDFSIWSRPSFGTQVEGSVPSGTHCRPSVLPVVEHSEAQ
jgi:PAS domain S-box-containing protein